MRVTDVAGESVDSHFFGLAEGYPSRSAYKWRRSECVAGRFIHLSAKSQSRHFADQIQSLCVDMRGLGTWAPGHQYPSAGEADPAGVGHLAHSRHASRTLSCRSELRSPLSWSATLTLRIEVIA